MAYTLADYARLATSDLKAGVIDILRQESTLMDYISFENWDSLSVEVVRTKSLPTVGTRKINEGWTESKGATDTIFDKMTAIGGLIDVDKLLVKSRSIVDQRALQTQMFVQAMALKFNDLFINGDPASDEDEFAGLWYRLVNLLPSSQTVLVGGLDVSSDASGLAANQLTLIDKLHELIDALHMGKGDFLIANNVMKLRLDSALRASGMLKTTEDAYGRKFQTFGEGGPKIIDAGVTDPLDKTARIIGNVELDDGSALTGGDATSIYALKMGGGQYCQGFQLYPMEVDDKGLLENGVDYRTIIDWAVGIYMIHPWSAARLVGIVAA